MKPTDLIKELINAGCVLKRVRGSHHIFYSPITNKIFPVPHPKSNWPISPVRTIKKSAGLYNPPPFEVFFLRLAFKHRTIAIQLTALLCLRYVMINIVVILPPTKKAISQQWQQKLSCWLCKIWLNQTIMMS